MKICIALTLTFCAALLTSGCTSTDIKAEEKGLDHIERNFNATAGGHLTLVSEFGAIDVQTADQDQVTVVVSKSTKSLKKAAQQALADFQVAFITEDADPHIFDEFKESAEMPIHLSPPPEETDLRIEGRFGKGQKHWRKVLGKLDIRFRVTVPKRYNLDLLTQGGHITVDDLDGTLRARTAGGHLRFGQITGPVSGHTSGGHITLAACENLVYLRTSGGNIEVVDVKGDVTARTSGGNLRFGDIHGTLIGRTSGGSIKVASCTGGAEVRTSGGSISLQNVGGDVNAKTSGGSIKTTITSQLTGDCSLHTSGGSITATLIPNIAIDVDAKTSGGSVSTDFVVESLIQGKVPKNRLEGRINGGGPRLKLKTSGGSIHLKQGDG